MVPTRQAFFRGAALFILPGFLFYLVFLVVPLLGTFFFSFSDWEGYSYATLKFGSVKNYLALARDPVYWLSLRNSLVFVVCVVFIQVGLGLVVAILLERDIVLGDFFRGSYFVPSVVSLVISGMAFSILLDPTLGIFSGIMKVVGLERVSQVWLSDPTVAFVMVAIIQIWYGFGGSMFIFVANLKGIDPQLYEAAKVDGVNEIKKAFFITIPLLKNAAAIALMTASMRTVAVFEVPYILTKGGPYHATEFLTTWAYNQGLSFNKVGYGSSISVTLVVVSFILGFLLLRFWNIEQAIQE